MLRSIGRSASSKSPIPTRFSADELTRIDRVRVRLGHTSRSGFIREAVLEKVQSVEASKMAEIRDVSESEAMRLIGRYLSRHPGIHYTSDIADALGIDLPVAFAAAEKLIARGKARVAEA